MKTPDFLVIGAQKSGTTTLFSLLSKHPEIYLPVQKEVQFFSNDELYGKGIEWYCEENFKVGEIGGVAGEISPQYMFYSKVPERIGKCVPEIKFITILRHPIKRAFSQYLMSSRRGQESRSFTDALAQSVAASESEDVISESQAYYQHSNYAEILIKYLAIFPKERFLLLFQEDLDKNPENVLAAIYTFLDVNQIMPENPGVRLHQSGEIKHQWLNRLLKGQGFLRTMLKKVTPWRIRAAIKFWIEQFNIKTTAPRQVPDSVLRDYNWMVREQKSFLKEQFDIDAPWQVRGD